MAGPITEAYNSAGQAAKQLSAAIGEYNRLERAQYGSPLHAPHEVAATELENQRERIGSLAKLYAGRLEQLARAAQIANDSAKATARQYAPRTG
ncbi:MAG: hypothetical protein ACREB9_08965 [Thermoplasmata archaeon]